MKDNRAWLITVVAIVLALVMFAPQQASAANESSKKPKAANVQYLTDSSGKKTGIRSFTISPFTYANLSQNKVINPEGASTLKLDDAALLRIAKQDIFPKWGVIAEGIFRDQASQLVTIEGSGMMSSDTSSKNSFDRHFSTGKVSNGYTYDWAVSDLAAYLGSDKSIHNGKTCWDEVRVTGPTQIGSLNGARTLMGQELRNCSDDNDLTKDDFLGNSYQKNDDTRRLPDLEDDKSGDGFANIVTCVNRAGASGDYDYVTFGLAVYGFDITPIAAENLKYIEAADDNYDVDGNNKKGEDILMGLAGNVKKTGISFQNDRENGTTTYIRNNTTQEVTQSSGLENSISEESTIGTDDTFEWGMEQEIGMELNMGGFGGGIIGAAADGIAAPCMFPRATFSMSNSWHELWSTTKSTSETKSATKTKTTNTEVTLPGHTIAVVNQSLENTRTTENYQQPVILSYKVAVFAMSGDYFNGASGGITNSRYDKQWMSVLFDGSDDVHTSGSKALGSLYNRGVVNKDTSGYDGAKGKYRSWCDKSAWNSSDKINWSSISSTLSGDERASHRIALSTGKKATTISDLATELPLLEKAQVLTSKRESITSSVDQIVPLYPLASVSMKSGSKQYELVPRGQQSSDESNTLHLDSIKMEGFDEEGADFYEFDQNWGKWELLDDEGNEIEDGGASDASTDEGVVQSGLIKLITDDNLDSQRIEVARSTSDSTSEEKHYIQWKLKNGTGEDGAKITSNESLNRSDEDGGPYMTDDEKAKVSTPKVEINIKDRESDVVNFEVNGSYKGPWNETVNLGHVLSVHPVDQSGKIRGVPIYWESNGAPGINVNINGQTSFTKKDTYKVRPYSYNMNDKRIYPTDGYGNPIWLEVTAQNKTGLSSIVINRPETDEAETELTEGMTSLGFDLPSYTKFYDQYGDIWEGEIEETKDEETGEIIRKKVLPEVRYSVTPNNYAVVDSEGMLTVTRAGTYIVTAKAYDKDGSDTGITIKPIRIDVTEKARLASIAFAEPALTRSERTLKTKDDVVTVKDLKSLISYVDQNGDEWTGKKPDITFFLDDVGDAAEIKGSNFNAYEPGRYTIRAKTTTSDHSIDPITIVILEEADLVLKSEDPGRQYLYAEGDQVELELERYIDAVNTFGGTWKGKVPELNYTLDKPSNGTSITVETVYENEDDYDGVDRHIFRTNAPGEYVIHVTPRKASEYNGSIDDINIRVVKGKKVERIEFVNIDEELDEGDLTVNAYTSKYPRIDLNDCLRYYDGFGEEIDPAKDHVKIPDCRFELIESDVNDADGYDLRDGVLTTYQAGMYFVKASINVTNNDPNDVNSKDDTILEDMATITTYDIDWVHNFGEWETGTQPICAQDGSRVKRCQGHDRNGDGEIDEECSEVVTDPVPATGHDWVGDDGIAEYEVIDGGYVAVRCQKCGAVNEDTLTKGTYGFITDGSNKPKYKEGNEATCTEPGIMIFSRRAVPAGYIEHTEVKVPATGHSWRDDYVVKDPATCSKTGSEVIRCKCNGCEAEREGSEYQRVIPRKAHTPDENGWNYVVDDGREQKETCEDFGWRATNCSNCGKEIYDLINPVGHDWDEGKVTKAATEQAEGEKTYTCTACKATKTQAIPKLKPSTPSVTPSTPSVTPSTPSVTPSVPKISGTPLAKMTASGKTSLVISWNRIQGAAGYDIFFAQSNQSTKKIKTIKGNKTLRWTKSGLKKGTAYKAHVRAYVYKNGKKTYVRNSPLIHAYTGNTTKNYTNARSITVTRTKVTLNKGRTFKITAKVNKISSKKKLMPGKYAPTLRYMTSNSNIATAHSGGRIVARGKGTCYIYVFAHNGVSKQVRVTVR